MLLLVVLCCMVGTLVWADGAAGPTELRAAFFNWTLDEASDTWTSTMNHNPAAGRDGWRARMEKLRADGYNGIILMGHHFRWSLIEDWPRTIEALAELADTAHSLGLRIYEHHSAALCAANRTDQPVSGGQKVWDLLEIKADTGEPINCMYDAYWLCPNHPTYRAVYLAYVRDIFTRAKFDGFMCDDVEMLPDESVCACRFCAERFRKLTGAGLPAWEDRSFWFNEDSPLWRQWVRSRQTSVADFYREVNTLLQELAPGAPLFVCQADPTGGGVTRSWALANDICDPAVGIRFWEDWQGTDPDYRKVWRRAILNLTYLDSLAGQRKPVLDLFYTSTEPQTYLRWACDRVTGAWTSTVEGCPRGTYMREFLAGPPGPPVANVALVHSAASRDYRASAGHVGSFWAWGDTLVESKASFAVLTEDQLERPEVLGNTALVVLPAVVCLSASALEALHQAMADGLRVALTADTAAYDETGAPRPGTPPAETLAQLPSARLIAREPQGRAEVRELLRWAGAPPVAQVRGASLGYCRLFAAGPGRYQLRVMQYSRTPNRPWRVVLPGRPIASARMTVPGGDTADLAVSGGIATVPAGAVRGYCQIDITCRH